MAAQEPQTVVPLVTRYLVGLESIPRDMQSGDEWNGGKILKVDRRIDMIVVESSDPQFPSDASARDDVEYVEEDVLRQLVFTPNDPQWNNLYGMRHIRADAVWDLSLGETTKNVCIIDTGLRKTHEDITGARYLGGWDFGSNDNDPADIHGHGTHVTGTAAASTNNAKGVAGAGQVGIKVAKVMNSSGQIYNSYVIDAIEWCADNDGHVINLSLGGSSYSSAEEAAVNYAWNKGMIVVAAAGNDGPCSNCVLYPARHANAIAVSCTTSSQAQCSFSSDGPQIDLAAPGYDILSTCYSSNTNYCYKSGTSMSSPHVAGAAALVWSLAPHLTNAEVRDLLEDNAKDLGAAGWDQLYGNGLVDAKAAFDASEVIHPQDPLVTFNFDGGSAPGWDLTGLWRVADNCATAPSSPKYLGYHRSSACDYNDLFTTSGTARFTVDLTDQLQATLKFKHRWETESNSDPYDYMQVQASNNGGGGAPWTTLAEWDSRDPNQLAWLEKTLYLNSYVGASTQIRFVFDAVDTGANSYDGWFIDDLVITATDNFAPIADAGPDKSAADPDGDGVQAVGLDGSGSGDQNEGGTLVSYQWYEGADLVATGVTPTASFAVGTHTVRLVVTDDGGATDEDTMQVSILPNTPPIARAGSDSTLGDPDGSGDASVTLDGSASTDSDGTIAAYEWRETGILLGSGVAPTLTLAVGAHDIELTAIDNGGASHTDLVQVTVNANQVPIAEAGAGVTTSDGDADGTETVHLDGSLSSDADGTIVSYEWREGETVLATTALADLPFGVGAHNVVLKVTDNGGATGTSNTVITVDPNHPPVSDPGPDREVSDVDGDGEQAVTLDGGASHDDDGTIASFTWKSGDDVLATASTATVTLPMGVHTITLETTDNGGATGTESVVISIVDNLSPVPGFAVDCAGPTCDFDGSLSTDDGTIVEYRWTFGDGDGATLPGALASHTYAAEGTYGVCLEVIDDLGKNGSLCQEIVVRQLLFFVDFDDGTAGDMTLSGLWRISSLCTTPPSEPNYLGYHNAAACSFYTGSANSGDAQFNVDLTAIGDPVLSFQHRWQTYSSSSSQVHKMYVQVKPEGAGGWTTLRYWDARNANQLSWQEAQVDLSAYSGTLATLRFRFESVFSFTNNYPGWHIDWVQVGSPGALILPPTPPVAVAGPDLTLPDSDGTGKETVRLDGNLSSDADGTLVSYEWKEGTTVIGTSAIVDHDFTVDVHTVTLVVTDDDGETASDTKVITINANVAPIASAGPDIAAGDADGDGTAMVALDGSGSSDADGAIVTFEWSEGGNVVATGPSPIVPLAIGAHSLQLKVTDNGALSDWDAVFVDVAPNGPPIARAGDDATVSDIDGTGLESYTLDAATSTDPDGPIQTFTWSLPDGTTLDGPTHIRDWAVGSYPIGLTVVDEGGLTSTDDLVVTILANQAPVAHAGDDVRKNDDDRNGVETIRLDGSASFDPDASIATWQWTDNGDVIATTPTADISFTVGRHDVVLTVTDLAGATAVDSLLVNITNNRPPVAAFTFVCTVVECDFDARTSSDPDGDPLAFEWSFGDGKTGEGATVTHAFPSVGSFTTCLTARDHEKSTSICKEVHLIATTFWEDFETGSDGWTLSGLWRVDNLCRAGPEGARSLGFHQSFICMYQGLDRVSGSARMTYDLTDGTTGTLKFQHRWVTESTSGSTARDVMAVRLSANGGSSYYTLAVWDSLDANQPDWKEVSLDLTPYKGKNIIIKFDFDSFNALFNHYEGWQIDRVQIVSDAPGVNYAPDASFTSDCDDPVCTLDGGASSDIGGVVTDWAWDFGDGTTGSGEVVDHMYTESGTFTVKLTVTDNGGATDVATRTVTVTGNDLPIASFTTQCTGLHCAFDAADSVDPNGSVVAWEWEFGDGETGSGELVDHDYAAAGTYNITLVVTDNHGATDTEVDQVTVAIAPNSPPDADFGSSCQALVCSFDASLSEDADGTIVSYAWAFGDGGTGNGVLAEHTFAAAGTYTVALTVTDDDGATDLQRRDIQVVFEVEDPITGPPSVPPSDPHAPDMIVDGADLTPASWMDVESVWLDDDADALYVGMKIQDIPHLASMTSRDVAFHARFEPGWTIADPTFGGLVGGGQTVLRFEVRAVWSTPTSVWQYNLYVETLDSSDSERRYFLSGLEGWLSYSTDIFWWRVPFELIQGTNGDIAESPQGFATPSYYNGNINLYGPPWDRTGAGREHTL